LVTKALHRLVRSFKGLDDLDDGTWDELIAEQGINDSTVIGVNDDNVDE